MSARVLVVAGHDPSYRGTSGGAGVDADREALEHHGARAACVVSAWTEQDGARVHAVRTRAPAEWLAEARALCAEPVHAVKSGLLANAEAVRALAELVDELRARQPALPVVVDPVLAASGGEPFLDERGLTALAGEILARRVTLTPNLPEAAVLTGHALDALAHDRAARIEAARALLELGAEAVVLKGGHAADDPVLDLCLARSGDVVWLAHPRRAGARLHGSGCRFAATLAAELARGRSLADGARTAGSYVTTLLDALPAP